MARRIAINLGQRIGNSTRGSERGRGQHGRVNRGTRNNIIKADDEIPQNSQQQVAAIPKHTEKSLEKDLKTSINHQVVGNSKNFGEEKLLRVKSTENEDLNHTGEPIRKRKTSEAEPTVKTIKKIKHETANHEGYEDEILQIMGFSCFGSTKQQHVGGTECYGINFKQRTEYRQYMNREGGFNRSLSPTSLDRKKIKLALKKKDK